MPGLVPGMPRLKIAEDVDGRDKPGHDDREMSYSTDLSFRVSGAAG